MNILVVNGTEQKGCTYAIKELLLDTLGRENSITEYYLPRDCPEFCIGCKACFYKDITVCPHSKETSRECKAVDRRQTPVLYNAYGSSNDTQRPAKERTT